MILNIFRLIWLGMWGVGGVSAYLLDLHLWQIAGVAVLVAILIWATVLLLSIPFPRVGKWSTSTYFLDLPDDKGP